MHTEEIAATGAAVVPARSVRRIQPRRTFDRQELAELWQFRQLLYFLVWRDVKARYKQTYLGTFWAVFRPFISMIVFTVIFNRLAGIKPGTDVPYPLFVFSGLLIWTYFSSALSGGSSSLLANANLISKAYFPRLFVPLAAVLAPLVDLALSFVIVIGMFVWYERLPSWLILTLPLFLLLTMVLGCGLGLWLGAVTVRYRDIPFVLPFLLQLWMYATPVIYPASFVPENWRWVLSLNPLTAATQGFQWGLADGKPPSWGAVGAGVASAAVLLVCGLAYFRRADRRFADVI